MRMNLAAGAAILLVAAATVAQNRPDFSGRWRLVEPSAAERAQDTLAITAPNELLIAQTPRAIVIEHPSTPGTHPEAGTFAFVVSGDVSTSSESRHETGWIGHQLTINSSMTSLSGPSGARTTHSRGSIWSLEANGRLTIDFSETRSGEFAKMARRTYRTVAPIAPSHLLHRLHLLHPVLRRAQPFLDRRVGIEKCLHEL